MPCHLQRRRTQRSSATPICPPGAQTTTLTEPTVGAERLQRLPISPTVSCSSHAGITMPTFIPPRQASYRDRGVVKLTSSGKLRTQIRNLYAGEHHIGREYCNPEVVAFLPQDMMRQIA